MNQLHNPPHPGEFILAIYRASYDISCCHFASYLDIAPSTLNCVLKGQSGISPEMALRLAKVVGRTPESGLMMHDHYDLWKAIKLSNVRPLKWNAA